MPGTSSFSLSGHRWVSWTPGTPGPSVVYIRRLNAMAPPMPAPSGKSRRGWMACQTAGGFEAQLVIPGRRVVSVPPGTAGQGPGQPCLIVGPGAGLKRLKPAPTGGWTAPSPTGGRTHGSAPTAGHAGVTLTPALSRRGRGGCAAPLGPVGRRGGVRSTSGCAWVA